MLCSCNNVTKSNDNQQTSTYDSILTIENFDTTLSYHPSNLIYNGKPLLYLGQNINNLDSNFVFNVDANGRFQSFSTEGVHDYYSTSPYYFAELTTGTISGVIFMSSDKLERVFALRALFDIDAEIVDTSGMEIMNYIKEKYFPILPNDFFKTTKKFIYKTNNTIEEFKFYNRTSAIIDTQRKWTLEYSMKPFKLQ